MCLGCVGGVVMGSGWGVARVVAWWDGWAGVSLYLGRK